MTIVSALKKLHKKMTGKDATGLNIANVIDSLQENYTGEGGGGGSLPDPGTAGNVMTSTGDGWESAAPSGGDIYEIVAEISVGTMELADGKYMYTIPVGTDLPDGELYWDTADKPLTKYTGDGDVWAYNFDAEFNVLGTPAYAITVFSEEEESATIVVSDSNAIENTTVKILKKVSVIPAIPDPAGHNGKVQGVKNGAYALLDPSVFSNDYKVTLTVTVDEQTQQPVISSVQSVADIFAAAVADKHVYAVVEIAQGYYQRFELHEYSEVEVVFYAVQLDEDGATSTTKPVLVVGNVVSGWSVID